MWYVLRGHAADLTERGGGPDSHSAGSVEWAVQRPAARAQPVRDPGGARLRVLPAGPDQADEFHHLRGEAPVRRADGAGQDGRELPPDARGRRRARDLPEAAPG